LAVADARPSVPLQWQIDNLFHEDWAGPISSYSALQFDPFYAYYTGGNNLILSGYSSLVERMVASITRNGGTLRPNSRVVNVAYPDAATGSAEGCKVTLEDGSVVAGSHCVITVSLGVLKSNAVTFSPPLPPRIQHSVDALDMGVQEHVWLLFDRVFWDTPSRYSWFVQPNDEFPEAFFHTLFSHAILPAPHNAPLLGFFVDAVGKWKLLLSDEEIIDRSMGTLRQVFGPDTPRPIRVLRSNWTYDKDVLGCYSYLLPGSSQADLKAFQTPVNQVLHFAGEHTSYTSWGFTYGALASGYREAQAILASPENAAFPQITAEQYRTLTAYSDEMPDEYYAQTFSTVPPAAASKRRSRRMVRKR
jgi:hypothetical protein